MSRLLERLREEGLFKLKKTVAAGRCPVLRCGNPSKAGISLLCHKHHQQRWRAGARKENAYALLKAHAKQRGIEFDLSYEYFAGIMDAMAYAFADSGAKGDIPTIDRVYPDKGYVRGNIRVVTLSENVVKSNAERYLPEHVRAILERKRQETIRKFEELERRMMSAAERDGECPF